MSNPRRPVAAKPTRARSNRSSQSGSRASSLVVRIPRPIGYAGAGASGMVHALMPDRLRKTLRYSDYYAIAGTGGALGSWIFNASGLYDPDVALGGHQPFGFDQLMAFYNRYTVLSARITIDVIAVSVPVFAGLAVSTNASAVYSNYNSYIESGTAAYRILEDPTPGTNRVTTTVDIAKWAGKVDLLDSDEYHGTTGANPAAGVYFHILAQDVNKTSTCNCEINVVIDFDVVFTLPRGMTIS